MVAYLALAKRVEGRASENILFCLFFCAGGAIVLTQEESVGFTWGTLMLLMAVVVLPAAMRLRAIFNAFPLVWLGRCSYSTYLWQELYYKVGNHVAALPGPLLLALSIATGWLSYVLIEAPASRFLRRHLLQRAARRHEDIATSLA